MAKIQNYIIFKKRPQNITFYDLHFPPLIFLISDTFHV